MNLGSVATVKSGTPEVSRLMSDELLSVLTRFHREVFVPDFERILGGLDCSVTELREEMLFHFDGLSRRFDRLEGEYRFARAESGIQP